MRTKIELPTIEFESEERQMAVSFMGRLALEGIRKRYHHLPYHNEFHAINVAVAANRIALEARATERQRANLVIAGYWHDFYRGKNAEARSAAAAVHTMDAHNIFKGRDRIDVSRFIMGTRVSIVDGAIIQAAEWKLEMILADADLAPFGQEPEVFWPHSLSLYREHHELELPEGDALRAYAASQAETLTKHHFLTEEAGRVYPFKQQNIDYMRTLSEVDQAA